MGVVGIKGVGLPQMKLGTRARYTLRLMMGLGRFASTDTPVSLGTISKRSGISRRYMDQLVVSLKNADLIRGRSGRGGGYTLGRPASEITVGEVIEAAIGPIAIAECVFRPESCIQSEFCQCRTLWQLINHRIMDVLNEYSLADLLDSRVSTKVRGELESLMEKNKQTATQLADVF
jgi:Rrf2 family iron-sulfur cluster assembly transcriptional regulator